MSHEKSDDAGNNHLQDDEYLTIRDNRETEIKILGSRFLSYAFPCTKAEEFTTALEKLRVVHYNATHHCFAWRMGYDGTMFRYSDDGEPAGTAGKRILACIDGANLTDVGIVVVRYFGGTKLGVGGLARAYSDAADAVLQRCSIERAYLMQSLRLSFPFDVTAQVHHAIDRLGAIIDGREYCTETVYTVRIRRSLVMRFTDELTERTRSTVVIDTG